MALFVNNGDEHVTIPDGRGGALIVPAGCEVVEGPDGALVALPRGTREADPADGQALPPIDESAYPPDAVPVPVELTQGGIVEEQVVTFGDGSPELFVPADEAGPFADAPVVAPPDEPATTKRRRGGNAA